MAEWLKCPTHNWQIRSGLNLKLIEKCRELIQKIECIGNEFKIR